MTRRQEPTRRAFLGKAAEAAGAVTASAVAGGAISGTISGCKASAGTHTRLKTLKAENSLPGEPHWWITHVGAPDAIQGFTGQASVLAGQKAPTCCGWTPRPAPSGMSR